CHHRLYAKRPCRNDAAHDGFHWLNMCWNLQVVDVSVQSGNVDMRIPLQLHCEIPLKAAINRKTQFKEAAPAGPAIRSVRRIVFALIKPCAEWCHAVRAYYNRLCVGDIAHSARLREIRESLGKLTDPGSGVGEGPFSNRKPFVKIAQASQFAHVPFLTPGWRRAHRPDGGIALCPDPK